MNEVYLGIGGNLHTPQRQIRHALRALRTLPQSHLLAVAPLYNNQAWGRKNQPAYCNTVVKMTTRLTPQCLLQQCQRLEKKQGRIRKVKWGARTLDLDILIYDNRRLTTPTLTLPHPRMMERPFVRIPLKMVYT